MGIHSPWPWPSRSSHSVGGMALGREQGGDGPESDPLTGAGNAEPLASDSGGWCSEQWFYHTLVQKTYFPQCISFLWLLQQTATSLVTSNNRHLFSHNFGGQSSKGSITRPKSRQVGPRFLKKLGVQRGLLSSCGCWPSLAVAASLQDSVLGSSALPPPPSCKSL